MMPPNLARFSLLAVARPFNRDCCTPPSLSAAVADLVQEVLKCVD